jgi:predicted nuclease with TOPRIM domain
VATLSEELEERTALGENLQEIVSHLERKVQRYEEEWEKLRHDLIHLSERHERLEGDCVQLRLQLATAQGEAEAAGERERLNALTIASEKHILLDQIRTERTLNAELA